MGEIKVRVDLENAIDRERFLLDELTEGDIRRLTFTALVDTEAVMLVLPEDVVDTLGLWNRREVIVSHADERKETRPVAGIVNLSIGERFMATECIVGPPLNEPLIGQIVLEELDLQADCVNQSLAPRPESPDRPLLKLK